MRRVKILVVIFSIYFFFLSNSELMAQNPPDEDKKLDEKTIKVKPDALNSTINITIDQYIDSKITEKIEEITEKNYKKKHEISDKILLHAQWLVTFLLAFFGILGFLTYRHLEKKAEIEINSIQTQSKRALDNLNEKINTIESEVTKTVKYIQARAYYDIATSNITKKKHKFALEFLLPLYRSNYELLNVCFHIGTCYKHLTNFQQALEFFEEAKTKAQEEGKESLINTIQKEIDEVRAKLKDSHS